MSISNDVITNNYIVLNQFVNFLNKKNGKITKDSIDSEIYRNVLAKIISKEIINNLNSDIGSDLSDFQNQLSKNLSKEICNKQLLKNLTEVTGTTKKNNKNYIEMYHFLKKEVSINE